MCTLIKILSVILRSYIHTHTYIYTYKQYLYELEVKHSHNILTTNEKLKIDEYQ